MYRLFIVFKYKPEEFIVTIYLYDESGKLIDSREYTGVKQVVFDKCRVSLSRHLKPDPFVLVVEVEEPRIDFRENSLLYISSSGG